MIRGLELSICLFSLHHLFSLRCLLPEKQLNVYCMLTLVNRSIKLSFFSFFPSITCCYLSITCCFPSITCCLHSISCCLPFITCCFPSITCCFSFIIHLCFFSLLPSFPAFFSLPPSSTTSSSLSVHNSLLCVGPPF